MGAIGARPDRVRVLHRGQVDRHDDRALTSGRATFTLDPAAGPPPARKQRTSCGRPTQSKPPAVQPSPAGVGGSQEVQRSLPRLRPPGHAARRQTDQSVRAPAEGSCRSSTCAAAHSSTGGEGCRDQKHHERGAEAHGVSVDLSPLRGHSGTLAHPGAPSPGLSRSSPPSRLRRTWGSDKAAARRALGEPGRPGTASSVWGSRGWPRRSREWDIRPCASGCRSP
jgi:hypothetical protein